MRVYAGRSSALSVKGCPRHCAAAARRPSEGPRHLVRKMPNAKDASASDAEPRTPSLATEAQASPTGAEASVVEPDAKPEPGGGIVRLSTV